MVNKTEITKADILSLDDYTARRKELRAVLVEKKKNRRLPVGPDCTFYFESYDTMLAQVQEMLFIEKGGDDQLEDELSAYNPLIPKGDELVATVMFEIPDENRRKTFLSSIGGIEETAFMEIDGETIKGVPEADVDRTTASGKASSVQFIHFPFTELQKEKFREENARVVVGFSHPNYSHMALMPNPMRNALAADFA